MSDGKPVPPVLALTAKRPATPLRPDDRRSAVSVQAQRWLAYRDRDRTRLVTGAAANVRALYPVEVVSSATVEAPRSLRQQPKLLDQVRDAIRTRHYSYRTEEAYVGWIKQYIFFHQKRHPAQMGKAEIEQFLTALAVKRHVAASTQNQALAAILFLYKDVLELDPGWLDDIVRAKRPAAAARRAHRVGGGSVARAVARCALADGDAALRLGAPT